MKRAGLSFSIRSILSKAHNSDSVYCGSGTSNTLRPECTNDAQCPDRHVCHDGVCTQQPLNDLEDEALFQELFELMKKILRG